MKTWWVSRAIWALTKCLVISLDIFFWGEARETEKRINPITSPQWAKLVWSNQYYYDKPHKAFSARPWLRVTRLHKCNWDKGKEIRKFDSSPNQTGHPSAQKKGWFEGPDVHGAESKVGRARSLSWGKLYEVNRVFFIPSSYDYANSIYSFHPGGSWAEIM